MAQSDGVDDDLLAIAHELGIEVSVNFFSFSLSKLLHSTKCI